MKPTVLLVNDDGINAPGLKSLYHAIKPLVNVLVVAPASQQSGKGLSITLETPLKAQEIAWEDTNAYKVYGTPADCIKVAITILKHKPDYILSGINKGCNSGRNVLYSGTIGGVIEGLFKGIPGIAFSCREFHNPQYHLYDEFIRSIFLHFKDSPIDPHTLINVNFPKHPKEEILGIRYAKQGKGYWVEHHHETVDDQHHFSAKWFESEEEEDSDVLLLKQGYITVSPLQVSHLTNIMHFEKHAQAFNEKFSSLFSDKKTIH